MGRSPKNRSTAVTDLKKVNKTVRRQRKKKKNIVLTIEEHPKYIGTNVEKRSKYEKVVKWEHGKHGKHWSFTGHKKGSFTLHLHFPSAHQPRWNGGCLLLIRSWNCNPQQLECIYHDLKQRTRFFYLSQKMSAYLSSIFPVVAGLNWHWSCNRIFLKRGLRLVTSCKKTKRHHVCNTSALHQHYRVPLRNTALHTQTGHISQWGHHFIPADL